MNPETTDGVVTGQAIEVADTDVGADDGTYVPPMLLLVFGLPIFLVLIYFFMQFTRPDRFGRMDKHIVDALARGAEGQGDEPDTDDADNDASFDDDDDDDDGEPPTA